MQERKKKVNNKNKKVEAATKLDTTELARVYGGTGGTKGEIVLIRTSFPELGILLQPTINPPLGPVTLPVPPLPLR